MYTTTDTIIGLAGDWHGDKAWGKCALYSLADAGVKTVLHLGDFGYWPGNSGDKFISYIHKVLVEKDMVLYVTLGNHEDYVKTSRLSPVPALDGFVYDKAYPRIVVATRGVHWNWRGVEFVSLGGANSIDFESRTEWISWWKAEQISMGDVYGTLAGGSADIMIAHDCPAGVDIFGDNADTKGGWSPTALAYAQESRVALRAAVDGVKPELLFHGHYHMDLDKTTTFFTPDNEIDYTVRTIGLDMNGSRNANIGLLDLTDKSFMKIPVNNKYVGEFYKNRELR